MPYQCPHCQNSDTATVESLFRNPALSTAPSSSPNSWATLSQTLKPPLEPVPPIQRKPTGNTPFVLIIFGLGALLFIWSGWVFNSPFYTTTDFGSPVPFAIIGMVLYAVAMTIRSLDREKLREKAREAYEKERIRFVAESAHYQKTASLWRHMVYCPRCHHVFVPYSSRTVAATNWQQLVV